MIFIDELYSSKAEPNMVQVDRLKKGLLELAELYPKHKIIAAGDINSFLTSDEPFC